MLRHEEDVAGARYVVSGRPGGVSTGPYGAANLGLHVGDDSAAVQENRRRFADAVGVPAASVVWLRQVHGSAVVVVDESWARGSEAAGTEATGTEAPEAEAPEADAAVTRRRDVALAVLVADCTPVLAADPHAGVLGVAHAGRPGLRAGVVPALLRAMRQLGARPEGIVARVGPSICGRHYEVPADMREDVAAVAPEARTVTERGTPALDVAAGVVAQLAPHCADVRWLPGCTWEDPDLFSYRRERTTGRFAGAARLLA